MPRVVVSGLSGGVGKTTVSLGLTRAFTRRNIIVHPFKKGPDYIDTAWLALAAKGRASNLDPFFLDGETLRHHFITRSIGAELAVIEGNRGLFDGKDIEGSSSTAEVARCLNAPVVLVVDITKMTRTTAALVAGCKAFPGGERIAGVILNRSGGLRHASIARRAVEELAGVTVFGVLPRLASAPIFERQAGLTTVGMHSSAEESLEKTADLLEDNVDIDAILALGKNASPLEGLVAARPTAKAPKVRIGVVRDDALWEYYDENIDALCAAGAEVIFVSLFGDEVWPEMDCLYLGGGDLAPYAAELAANVARKRYIREQIEAGMPVYAEHAGYFYLGEQLTVKGVTHEMAGVFSVSAMITAKPARLGYMEAALLVDSPFYPAGTKLKGHEYHYAHLTVRQGSAALRKSAGGVNIDEQDGLVYKSAFGTSMQVFAPSVSQWAVGLVQAAEKWKNR